MKMLVEYEKYINACNAIKLNFNLNIMRGYALGAFGKRPAIVVSKPYRKGDIVDMVKAEVAHFYTVDDFMAWSDKMLTVETYQVGSSYETNQGDVVDVVDDIGQDYTRMCVGSDGVNRFNRESLLRDNGRPAGTARNGSHPDAFIYPPKAIDTHA